MSIMAPHRKAPMVAPDHSAGPRHNNWEADVVFEAVIYKPRRESLEASLTPSARSTDASTSSLSRSGSFSSSAPRSQECDILVPVRERSLKFDVESPVLTGGSCEYDAFVRESSLECAGYTFQEEIMKNTLGGISLVTDMRGEARCVKRFDKSQMKEDSSAAMRAEVATILELGRHRNITEVFDTFHDPNFYYMVQPYYKGGDLVGLKRRAEADGFVPTEAWWKTLFCQCLEGLDHIHRNGIVHCDIKEPNIMLKGNDMSAAEVVIIDFGVAQRVETTERAAIYGTPGYIAPEVWDTKIWCPKGDMFSFGVVVVQLLLGKVGIFTENAKSFKEVKEATQKRLPPLDLMPVEFPSFHWLAKHLLAKDSRDRPTASSLLSEPWGEEDEDVTKDRNFKRRHTVHAKEDAIDNDEDAMEGKESDRKLVRRNTTNLNLAAKATCEARSRDVKALPNLLPRIGATSGSLLAPVKVARGSSVAAPTASKLLRSATPYGRATGSLAAPTSSFNSSGTACAMTNPYAPRTITSPAKPVLPLQQFVIGAQLVR